MLLEIIFYDFDQICWCGHWEINNWIFPNGTLAAQPVAGPAVLYGAAEKMADSKRSVHSVILKER